MSLDVLSISLKDLEYNIFIFIFFFIFIFVTLSFNQINLFLSHVIVTHLSNCNYYQKYEFIHFVVSNYDVHVHCTCMCVWL